MRRTTLAIFISLISFAFISEAQAASPLTWIPTWYASPESGWSVAGALKDQTLRQVVRTSVGGGWVRIRLSNAGGSAPLHLDKVEIALRTAGGLVNLASRKLLYFRGQRDVTIAPGADMFSDPALYDLPPQTDLAVSIYAKAPAAESTLHVVQRNAIYVMDGDVEGAAAEDDVTQAQPTGQAWIWLDEVEVAASPAKGVVVAFGDSITDGVGPPADTRTTWPEVLFQRFRDAGLNLGVINAGIGGNRLLHPGTWGPFGAPGLARFDADVLDQRGVRAVIVLIGINDIGQVGQSAPAAESVTAEDIEAGLAQLAQRAHGRGLKVYVGTLTPFKVSIIKGYYSDDKELERQAVNAWIRTNTAFDGVVDFDRAVSDPGRPGQILPLYDSSDHLHPSAAGDAALAAAIPLDWFRWPAAPASAGPRSPRDPRSARGSARG